MTPQDQVRVRVQALGENGKCVFCLSTITVNSNEVT
jgi:hypothetical protein